MTDMKMQDMQRQSRKLAFIVHFNTLLSVIFRLCVYLCSIDEKKLVLCIIFVDVILINCNLAYAFST